MASVNEMGINQASALINEIHKQVTGQKGTANEDLSSFVSVATTTLEAGYEPVNNALMQIISKTIFDYRPYEVKFSGLRKSGDRFGGIINKNHIADKDFENDVCFDLEDGQSVDHYRINKPDLLQTHFYGSNQFRKRTTMYTNQLDTAMEGPAQLGQLATMQMGNFTDTIAQNEENLSRAVLANFIGAKVAMAAELDAEVGRTSGVVHLLTEYNKLTGQNLTEADIYKPDNVRPFFQWVFARFEEVSSKMTERSVLYQANITGKKIMHHTPRDRQRAYIYAPAKAQIDAQVLANTYHDSYLTLVKNEGVNFWQTLTDPMKINVTPVYPRADGTLQTGEATTVDKIFGVILDDEAVAYTIKYEKIVSTPLNADGLYINNVYHGNMQFINDFLEKGVVFLLD